MWYLHEVLALALHSVRRGHVGQEAAAVTWVGAPEARHFRLGGHVARRHHVSQLPGAQPGVLLLKTI